MAYKQREQDAAAGDDKQTNKQTEERISETEPTLAQFINVSKGRGQRKTGPEAGAWQFSWQQQQHTWTTFF